MGTQEPRRHVRHNESQRERIITATAQLVKERGVDDLSMSDIAERAGTGNDLHLAQHQRQPGVAGHHSAHSDRGHVLLR